MTADLTALGGADPHDVLGLRRGASPQQVNQAFHRQALRGGHPDTGGDARAFRRLVVARDALLAAPVAAPGPVTGPSARPGPSARSGPSAPPSSQARTAARPTQPPPSSDANVLPLIVLGLLLLVGVPHVLLALVIMLVP